MYPICLYIVFLFVAELEESKIGTWGEGLTQFMRFAVQK